MSKLIRGVILKANVGEISRKKNIEVYPEEILQESQEIFLPESLIVII